MKLEDFSECKIVKDRIFDGMNGKKIAIIFKDDVYMLKFPKDTHLTNGYASSTINEYISSNIFKTLGLKTQDTFLGYYNDKVVVACKDFEGYNKRLLNFGKVKNSVINSSGSFADTDLQDTLNIIQNQELIDKDKLKGHFWDMFIADTLIANFDRHNGNWGLLLDENRKIEIAPIYDCGSSLYPKLSNADIKKYLGHKGSFNDLMLNITTSAITKNGKKLNPQNFLFETKKKDALIALDKITKQIDYSKIDKIIDGVEIISDERKSFYKQTIRTRKEKIFNKILKHTELDTSDTIR